MDFKPSPQVETLRERILDDAGLPYIKIPLKFAWRIQHNEHPNTYGDQVIAAAIVFLGDKLGVGSQLSTAVVVVLGIRIFGNAAAIRRHIFRA